MFRLIILFTCLSWNCTKKSSPSVTDPITMSKDSTFSYLALGDSYTIGEQVALFESFPYQTVQLLRKKNLSFFAPEIVAKTGWTTDELQTAIDENLYLKKYDFVSLLIGVNNQYRGRDIEQYKIQFEKLLQKGISFSGNNPQNVFVLSIPDWGITPFAKEKDSEKIATEIDLHNNICKEITEAASCSFINITAQQRLNNNDLKMIAEDGLHPSQLEYARWAEVLAEAINACCSV